MTASSTTVASIEPAGVCSATGLSDPQIAQLLHVVLSRLLGQATGNREFVRMLCVVLAGVGRLPFRRNDNRVIPPVDPTLPATGWSDGTSTLNRLGMNGADLDRLWAEAEAIDGIHAVLPLEVVIAFFPPQLWPVAQAVVRWGPGETAQRIERFWRREAQRQLHPTRARPEGGTITESTVRNGVSLGRRLPKMLCELRSLGYPAAVLDDWIVNPPINVDALGAVDDRTDRGAPPLLLVRRTLRTVHEEIEQRRRTKRGAKYLQTLLRKRLVLALLAVTGARIGALSRTSVRDYDRQHRFPDGTVGPALRLFPGKTVNPTTARWKALPAEVAGWLEEHLDFLGITDDPSSPLWPSYTRPGESMRSTSLATLVAGEATANDPRRPLLPKEPGSFDGYSAHTLRHLAEQYAYQAGSDYLAANAGAPAVVTPQVFVDSLLDRAIDSDRLGYKDLNTPASRERWAREAVGGVWDYIWGSRGARHVPDFDRIERATHARDELRGQLAEIDTRIAELRKKHRQLARRGEQTKGATTDDLIRIVIQLAALSSSLDQEHEEANRLQRSLLDAEIELRESRQALVPIADDAPDPDEAVRPADDIPLESAAIELRDFLYPLEAAEAFGVSAATMRRWFRGELTHPEGDPRNPWQPSEVGRVIDCTRGAKKRRLLVSELDRSKIAPDVMQSIKALLQTPPRAAG